VHAIHSTVCLRFELYNIFVLLVGILIFDVESSSSASEVVAFEVILILLFVFLCLFTMGIQFWIISKLRQDDDLMKKLSMATSVDYDVVKQTIAVSDSWQKSLPDAVLSVNPLQTNSTVSFGKVEATSCKRK
jgi:hypothetical protein